MRKAAAVAISAALLTGAVACSGSSSSSPGSSSAVPSPTATGKVAWSYSGPTGPEHWAELSTAYTACGNGKEQSPINITNQTASNTANPKISYAGTEGTLVNTGHTIEMTSEGNNTLAVAGKAYELEQMHFHSPSESMLNGQQFDAEFHFVHEAADHTFAVLTVFAKVGAGNAAWQPFIAQAGIGEGDNDAAPVKISWSKLPPPLKSTIQFKGSLTTPPCTEGLAWVVNPAPITLSQAQIDALRSAYSQNIRPDQPINGRTIVQNTP